MASERKKSKKEVEFSWSDDELQLLSQTTLDYKAKYEFNTENWETKGQNYEDIFYSLMKEYRGKKEKNPEKEKINKERVAAKFKIIPSGFKKAIDCRKKVVSVV